MSRRHEDNLNEYLASCQIKAERDKDPVTRARAHMNSIKLVGGHGADCTCDLCVAKLASLAADMTSPEPTRTPLYFASGCTIMCRGGKGCSEPDPHGIGTMNSPSWAEAICALMNRADGHE